MNKAEREALADIQRGHATNIEFSRIYLLDALRGLTFEEATEVWWEANGYSNGTPSKQAAARQYTARIQAALAGKAKP
jgi:hypothetical protein